MSIRALRTLLAIQRLGTFARAAEAVGLTQSAVSLHIKALEEEFQARLFDRSKRRPVLTDAGEVAVAHARHVVALYDAIPAALAGEGELAGRLRLGAVQTVLTGPLPGALALLREDHPRLRVHVQGGKSAELAALVASGDLDAAITTQLVRPHPEGLVARPLNTELFWLMIPPDMTGDDPHALLRAHPFIRFDPRAWAGRMIDAELRRLDIQVNETMVLDSLEAIAMMVARGLGVSIIPIGGLDLHKLARHRLLPFGEPQLSRGIVMLERADRADARAVVALGDAILAGLNAHVQ